MMLFSLHPESRRIASAAASREAAGAAVRTGVSCKCNALREEGPEAFVAAAR
jgi:hypothetical protein